MRVGLVGSSVLAIVAGGVLLAPVAGAAPVAPHVAATAGGITGRLVDTAGRPIVGAAANADIETGGSGSARTRADGSFVLDLAPGDWTVCFNDLYPTAGTGHIADCYGEPYDGTPVTVVAGRRTALGSQVLQTGAALTGVVSDAGTGEPIPAIDVDTSDARATGTTDADGSYTIRSLSPSRVGACVYPGRETHPAAAPYGYLVKCSAPVQTIAGRTVSASVRLAPAGGVSGLVTDQSGRPLRGVQVSATADYQDNSVTDGRGRYTLAGVPPGRQVAIDFRRMGAKTLVTVGVVARKLTNGVDAVLPSSP